MATDKHNNGTITEPSRKTPGPWEIFKLFFRIGALGFGGGPALISIIKQEVVDKHKWVDDETYVKGLTVSLMPPGSMMVNIAFFIGDLMAGLGGGLAALTGILLPSFFIVVGLAAVFASMSGLNLSAGILKGMAPAVVGVLIALVWKLSRQHLCRWWAVLLMAVSAVLMYFAGFSPPVVVIGAIALAVIFWIAGMRVTAPAQVAGNPPSCTREVSSG